MRSALLAAVATALLAVTALLGASSSEARATDAAPSSNVALIPGFHSPKYSPTATLPGFPAAQLPGYHFTAVPLGSVTSASLGSYDTVVLYGLLWSDLSSSEQAAVNEFAKTGKVIIWDADATGAQDYGSFLHPFTTKSSGATGGSYGAVVTFPATSPLASPDAGSPLYLDPAALVASTHLIGHMNVLVPPATDWSPGLIAANSKISDGGWVVAWGYGTTATHAGMVVYTGIDADAFTDAATPNYAIKELSIQLAAPFSRTGDSGCAPNCTPPPPPPSGGSGGSGGGGSSGGSGTSGIGAPQTPTFAQCSFSRRPPRSWVRGTVYLSLTTSVADGIRGTVTTAAGKVVGTGTATVAGHLALRVDTRMLPSNRVAALKANVIVNAASACSLSTALRVDNVPARALGLRLSHSGLGNLLTFRPSEPVRMWLVTPKHRFGTFSSPRARKLTLRFPASAKSGTLLLVDRAGNTSRLHVAWK